MVTKRLLYGAALTHALFACSFASAQTKNYFVPFATSEFFGGDPECFIELRRGIAQHNSDLHSLILKGHYFVVNESLKSGNRESPDYWKAIFSDDLNLSIEAVSIYNFDSSCKSRIKIKIEIPLSMNNSALPFRTRGKLVLCDVEKIFLFPKIGGKQVVVDEVKQQIEICASKVADL